MRTAWRPQLCLLVFLLPSLYLERLLGRVARHEFHRMYLRSFEFHMIRAKCMLFNTLRKESMSSSTVGACWTWASRRPNKSNTFEWREQPTHTANQCLNNSDEQSCTDFSKKKPLIGTNDKRQSQRIHQRVCSGCQVHRIPPDHQHV